MWIAETIDLDNHDSVVKFMKNQSGKIKKLEKENEQLKKELDQFYLLIGRGDWSGLIDLIKGDVE